MGDGSIELSRCGPHPHPADLWVQGSEAEAKAQEQADLERLLKELFQAGRLADRGGLRRQDDIPSKPRCNHVGLCMGVSEKDFDKPNTQPEL